MHAEGEETEERACPSPVIWFEGLTSRKFLENIGANLCNLG